MIKISSTAIVVAFVLSTLTTVGAFAAGLGGNQPRAWVSANGADAAGCGTGSAPCRTFQYAHDNIVQPGGSIFVHDAGNYGQLLIAHAISIINDDVGTTTIFASSGDAIAIAARSTDSIFIKGLTLDGAGTGSNGINLTVAGSLTVANCTIKGFGATGGNGIYIAPTSGFVSFRIFDTIVSANYYAGIYISPSGSGSASGTLRNVSVNNNGSGLWIQGASASATVVNSDFSQNGSYGIYVDHGGSSVSNSLATGNGTDLFNGAGTLTSYQNNIYSTFSGAITPASLH